jgi:hypothetical protein
MKIKYLLLQVGLVLGLIHGGWAQPVITAFGLRRRGTLW